MWIQWAYKLRTGLVLKWFFAQSLNGLLFKPWPEYPTKSPLFGSWNSIIFKFMTHSSTLLEGGLVKTASSIKDFALFGTKAFIWIMEDLNTGLLKVNYSDVSANLMFVIQILTVHRPAFLWFCIVNVRIQIPIVCLKF